MRHLTIMCLITFSLLVLSCKQTSSSSDTPVNSIKFPLKLNNTWQYKYYQHTGGGEEAGGSIDTSLVIYNLHMNIDSMQTSPQQAVTYRLKSWITDSKISSTPAYNYLNSSADGLFEYGNNGFVAPIPWKRNVITQTHSIFNPVYSYGATRNIIWYANPALLLPYPANEGKTWIFQPVEDMLASRHTLIDHEWVTVPAGRFYCVVKKIVFEDPDFPIDPDKLTYRIYYHNGGIIKATFDFGMVSVTDAEGNLITTFHSYERYELESYHLN